MKRIFLTLSLVTFIILSFSSCSGVRQVAGVQSTSFTPDYVRVESNINDYVLLGESVVSIESREYLGFIKKIDKVNGEYYNFRDVKIVELEGNTNIDLRGDIKMSPYKVVDEYPQADYYVPTVKKTEVERMFMGKFVKESVVIKAYQLRP